MTIQVMVVDDSAVVRQVVSALLAADPAIEVISAVADPVLAMARMQSQWPDVIVLDIEMPRMDGITFLKKIMSERPTPVVICSTLAETGAVDWRDFTTEEQVRTEAAAAAISLGLHHTERALALLQAARRRVAALPDAGAAVHRPLGIACHNMAWTLHDRGNARSVADTVAMLAFAAGSKLHWSKAGTWLEVERGDYDLARCHLAAGQFDEALVHAAQCLATCTQNNAPPYEHFFAHEALARAQHARGDAPARVRNVAAAAAAFDSLSLEDQAACRTTLGELKALGP